MPFVKGEDLKISPDKAYADGEFSMVYPDQYYFCQLRKLFKDEESRNETICVEVDAEYSFYQVGLWGEKTLEQYHREASWFLFAHNIRDNTDVNKKVEEGKARALTRWEF